MTNSSIQNSSNSIKILWEPPALENTVIGKFIAFTTDRTGETFSDYKGFYNWSIENQEHFWSYLWDFTNVIGDKGSQVIQKLDNVPWARFFPDSKISYAENMLARVFEKPDEPAIIARLQGEKDRVLSWQELYNDVSRWEQLFIKSGLCEGDHIGVYLSNIPETISILLAASNLGIIFTSAGMEMGAKDLINRFGQVQPKLFITADGYVHGKKNISRLDVVKLVQEKINSIKQTIILQLIDEDNLDISGLKNTVEYTECINQFHPKEIIFNRRDFNYPLYVLFSSGSTGKPKCFEHSTGGILLKHISEYVLHCEVMPGDKVFYHATPSWMMWNWLASGLAMGATILMYDGSPAYPDANAQWDFTASNGCTHHGTAAPVILSWDKADIRPREDFDLSALRMIMSTGAILPSQGFEFIHEHVKQDVKISPISGGTDIVGCFVGGNALMPTYAGQINAPILGMNVQIWDDKGKPVKKGEIGELVCINSFPSMPLRFLNDPDGARYKAEYFEYYDGHVWRHGDSVEVTNEGQFIIVGRSDATLNQNGVRIGSAVIYDQLVPFADQIKDSAAIDFTRPDNKQAMTILFLAIDNYERGVSEDLQKAICTAVKNNVTPYAIPSKIIAVPDILKTPNGKKAEVVMKKIINGKEIPNASLYGEELVEHFIKIGADLIKTYS
ncbi:MAG: acetoacetate--CoA ligase [Alphaproteobacteria bacterium]|nr:acetoacetate--CoA ligase [Alphaproteobacteria bacterium]